MISVSLTTVKFFALLLLFIISGVCGLLPLFFIPRSNPSATYQSLDPPGHRRVVISLLNCVAAGVFLATCFLDLLPDVISSFQQLSFLASYPTGEIFACIGFILIMLLEQSALAWKERSQPQVHHHHSRSNTRIDTTQETSSSFVQSAEITRRKSTIQGVVDTVQTECLDNEPQVQHSRFRSLMLLLALSFHSLLEGSALGLKTSKSDVFEILIALCVHKATIGFSLGISLCQSSLSIIQFIESIFGFAIASPIGIAVSTLLLSEDNRSEVFNYITATVQGLATGTFLYIIFFEILPPEFNNCKMRIYKSLAFISGFVAMTLLIIFMP